MPLHSLHLLQLLNVGCFAPLKRAYYKEIEGWSQYAKTQVKKETFLLAFYVAFSSIIIKKNNLVSFRGAGLAPYNLE